MQTQGHEAVPSSAQGNDDGGRVNPDGPGRISPLDASDEYRSSSSSPVATYRKKKRHVLQDDDSDNEQDPPDNLESHARVAGPYLLPS